IKSNKCNDSAFLSTTVTVLPLPDVTVKKSNDIDCSIGFSQLNAFGARRFLWLPALYLNNNTIANPVATPPITTQYLVKGIDDNGCENTGTVTIIVALNVSSLYLMPTSFTPNNDGLNDCFGPKYWGTIEELDFNIYNRFGEKVFHTNKPAVCWDGKYKGTMQDSNVFIYTIKAKTACGAVNKKGSVVLLK
ncbi:MAG: gliding motility-associated C-terminal domain-containing protein, partial [Ginsengibacter sp.]